MAGGGDGARGPTRSMLLVAGSVVVAVLALVAYLMWPRTPEHVLVVGDSVTYLSWDALNDRFGADTALEPVARPGFRSTDLLPLVRAATDRRESAGHRLDRAVFLVGYNDVWRGDADRRGLQALVEESARYECAVWLTIPTAPGGRPPATGDFDVAAAERLNERLADLVGEHGNLHLARDWERAVDGAPPVRYLEPDGIHPNRAGQELLAAIIHDRVLSACRFP